MTHITNRPATQFRQPRHHRSTQRNRRRRLHQQLYQRAQWDRRKHLQRLYWNLRSSQRSTNARHLSNPPYTSSTQRRPPYTQHTLPWPPRIKLIISINSKSRAYPTLLSFKKQQKWNKTIPKNSPSLILLPISRPCKQHISLHLLPHKLPTFSPPKKFLKLSKKSSPPSKSLQRKS